jgi:hypothetical protein
MPDTDVLAKIRSRGYWDVAIHPGHQLDRALALQDLTRLLEANTVRMRGWPVPFIDHRNRIRRGNDWIGQDIDAQNVDHYEAWRFFTSAQFTQLRAISADWRVNRERTAVPRWASAVIEVWEVLYYLTELVELAARRTLASSARSFVIDATLTGMQDRALISGTPMREFDQAYLFSENDIRVKESVSSSHLTAEPRQIAVEMSAAVLARFGFHATSGVLEDYQRELLGRP